MEYGPARVHQLTMPAGTRSMLAGTADRERAVDVLRAGFAEGRLTREEFDHRVARVYASRTYGELGTLTGDLPAGPNPYHQPSAEQPADAPPGRSVTPLVLTALVIFTLAALVTALLSVRAAHPFITQLPVPHVRLAPALHGRP